jgi:hypothetical protein
MVAPYGLAQEQPAGQVSPAEISDLKTQLAEQQKQIEQLRSMLIEQKKLLDERASDRAKPANLGQVASTAPVVPVAPSIAPPLGSFAIPSAVRPPAPPQGPTTNDAPGPLQIKIGDSSIIPIGFMDMTSVSRSTNPGTGIGTNFGSIPYGNTQLGSLTETRLSPQNSRIGMRIDTGYKGVNILGYWESDFLGQIGAPPNGAIAVTSNSYPLRLRLYWVNVNKGHFEFLAGQSWSLLTPGRTGISPLPGNIFYSQDIDVNYQAGLVWGRIPGFRGTWHFNDNKAAFAVALENSEPYVGGGNGGSAFVCPAAICGTPNAVSGAVLSGQINNGASVISAAALHPDIIAKLAFDPSKKFHIEIAGVEITNKISNPASTPPFQTSTKAGGGGSLNINFEAAKNVRIFLNNYWSAGGGRYIFGQAPDFIIRANGNLSLVRSGSTVSGFEATAGKTLIYGYYGGVYIGRNLARDANGTTLIGYGPISSDGQNRTIQEATFGTNTTLAKDPKWGALNLMFQLSYLQRNPWLAAAGAPTNAHLWMGFFNFRYTLPGSPLARTLYTK